MRLAGRKNLTIWEWVVVLSGVVSAILITNMLDFPPKWEHVTVYTIIVFMAVVIPLRPAWGRATFWKGLAVAFLLHGSVFCVIVWVLPQTSLGIRGIPLILLGMAEALFIASILWRIVRGTASRANRSSANAG